MIDTCAVLQDLDTLLETGKGQQERGEAAGMGWHLEFGRCIRCSVLAASFCKMDVQHDMATSTTKRSSQFHHPRHAYFIA